jgi:hypothetical protein
MTRLLPAFLAFAFIATPAAAHDSYKVTGKVITRDERSFELTNQYGSQIFVAFDKNTVFTRGAEAATSDALAVGQTVVVNGEGDSQNELEGRDVQIIP